MRFNILFICVTFFSLAALGGSAALAQVRSSDNYMIERDSINTGGGFSESESYTQESTFGEVATGYGDSENYTLHAGYQQLTEAMLYLSVIDDVTMQGAIGGITGGTSVGTTSVHVRTDSNTGYQITIEAENAPAMQSPLDTIADYVPASTSALDYAFSTGANEAHFGFSVDGPNVHDDFKSSATTCGSGTDVSDTCWAGLSTSPRTFGRATGPNMPEGTTSTLQFKVGIGSDVLKPEGIYTATATVTLLPL